MSGKPRKQGAPSPRTPPFPTNDPAVVFRHVPDFPGYAVSSDGFLWSCRRRGPAKTFAAEWGRLEGGRDKDGYRKAILCNAQGRTYRRIHCLILEVFVGPCPGGMEARHEDGVCDHNALDNLSWATHKDNISDKERHGTAQRGSKNANAKIDERIARRVKRLLRTLPPGEVAARCDVSPDIVYTIKAGKAWKHVS